MPIFITFLFNFIWPQVFFSLYGSRNGTPVGQTSLRILRLLFCDSEERIISEKLSKFWHAFRP